MITAMKLKDKLLESYQENGEIFTKPFITIAREPGSGGAPIAKKLAQKLDFIFVDEQIIDDISHSIKKSKAIIREIDEKSRTRINDIVHSILNPDYVDNITYLKELTRIILAYAHKGHVVILGRGANFICPFARGLHVNVVAPYAVRVNRAMEFEGFTRQQAKKVIAKEEKERKDFVKQYFRKKLDAANSYDLTINTNYFTINRTVELILEAFYRKFGPITRYKALVTK
jgi:cytidylate kinase